MLNIFAGFPGKNAPAGLACLNAGGLQHCIEEVERLAELEHDPMICYAREGVYAIPKGINRGERLGDVQYRLSPLLEHGGITWDWFPEYYGFGNGITILKVTANREMMLVDHRSGTPVNDLIVSGHPIELGKLIIQQVPKRTEGWALYEKRWLPHTCPQESHIVHLTCIITRGELGTLAYNRILRLIEDPSAVLVDVERYRAEHFSVIRKWNGKRESKEWSTLLEGLR